MSRHPHPAGFKPRKNGRKGQYVNNHWYDDIAVIPEERRIMPYPTIPDELISWHTWSCRCPHCAAHDRDFLRKLKRDRVRKMSRAKKR